MVKKRAGIPGTPAGLVWLSHRYGVLPLTVALAPAVRLARGGFGAHLLDLASVRRIERDDFS